MTNGSKYTFRIKRPVPLYRKLALENKLLLFLGAILIVLGGTVSLVSYNVLNHGLRGLYARNMQRIGQSIALPLARAARNNDYQQVHDLLKGAMFLDDRVAYMAASFPNGTVVALGAQAPSPQTITSSIPIGRDKSTRLIQSSEGRYLETDVSFDLDGKPPGRLRLGFPQSKIDSFLRKSSIVILLIMILPMALILVASQRAIRYAIRPLKELTRVADKISTGDLDERIDFGVRVHCWDIKGCQRTDCKAYMNFTEQCWYVDGTPCEGYTPNFPEKLEGCRSCEVYRTHRSDEIVQLADAFKHMTNSLKGYRDDLVKALEYQDSLIRNSFDGIIATNEKGEVTIFNRVAERLTGYSREHLIGSADWEHLFEKQVTKLVEIPLTHGKRRRLRGFAPRESRLHRIDGDPVDVRIAGISMYEGGIHLGKVFFFQDMREIKKLRADLVASERLAATGQAAASISHSIKNILSGLQGGAYIYKRGKRLEDQAEIDIGWDMVERNVAIIGDLVKDLLNFAKDRLPEIKPTNVKKLFEDVVAAVGADRSENIKVVIDVQTDMGDVLLDDHAFHQCLANLVKNAMESIEAIDEKPSGTVTLSASNQDGQVQMQVADDGEGMSEKTLEKIRGGMYSTKGSKGTGLGLMVVGKVVKEHGGTLSIESNPGQGARFSIRIPQDLSSEGDG